MKLEFLISLLLCLGLDFPQPFVNKKSSPRNLATGIAAASEASSSSSFRLGIRDSFMIAHSFHNHPAFGPAGGMHGATYDCHVEFESPTLHPETNWVLDIGYAKDLLREVLNQYNLKNLDQIFVPSESDADDDAKQSSMILTTTEFMARQIHADICRRILEKLSSSSSKDDELPVEDEVQHTITNICVKLFESPDAWASYQGPLQ